jgi:DNA polymerase-3 subunit gamma/tau
MAQQLSLSARPRTLDALIGQQKIVEAIRGHAKSGRLPKAWLFSGPAGTGKTTTARILSISYQCTHQEIFGNPCKECYKNRSQFSIQEINASEITGKDDIRDALSGSELSTLLEGKYRVYILDECHNLSTQGQSLILKYLEDSPESAVFILCSTAPEKILPTIRSRCQCYEMRELNMDDTLKLTTRLLKIAKSTLPADRLADALSERHVRYPRLIAQAVEKYVSGMSPEDAAQVEGVAEVNVRAITTAMTKGDWEETSRYLLAAQPGDMRSVRIAMIAFLRSVLLENPISDRTKVVANSIISIASLTTNTDDLTASAVLCAEIYRMCAMFSKYPL